MVCHDDVVCVGSLDADGVKGLAFKCRLWGRACLDADDCGAASAHELGFDALWKRASIERVGRQYEFVGAK